MESNIKAMRKALKKILRSFYIGENGYRYSRLNERDYQMIEAALSAPLRNCDRFADELDAQLAFLNEVWLISIDRDRMDEQDEYDNWTDEMRKRYGRWLLAPAAERKGEEDGSK